LRVPAEETAAAGGVVASTYDGVSAAEIAQLVGAPRVVVYASVGSTMDEAHTLGAAGCAAGAVVLADGQSRGRGRQGRDWRSPAARGVWVTLLERPAEARRLEVLSLRVGLHAARALDPFAEAPVRLKWPNDLYVTDRKLGGVLVEARWRGTRPDWVAIGIGVNVVAPDGVPGAIGLRGDTPRLEVLAALVPAVRAAAARAGLLDADELREFAARDYAHGRRCTQPSAGVVRGVTAAGELLIEDTGGVRSHRAGSLVLEEGA
jgi:BirA family transcriptional regulator, biotin operon repressor / biotin---[acetyl-CoA-carboxylase] ligase